MLAPSLRPWLVGWLLFIGGAIVLTLFATNYWVNEHRDAGRALIQQRATARVNAYGGQVDDMIGRIDQLGHRVMADWRRQADRIDFDSLLIGVYPADKQLFVAIYDSNSRLLAASFAPASRYLGNAAFIEHHRAHCCDGWRVTPVEFSPVVGESVFRLSHRLSNRDGSFGGAIAIAMTPDFLRAFEDDAVMGPRDFITLHMVNGPVLTTKLGSGRPPQIFYKEAPSFEAAQGIRLEPGVRFIDNRARWVAWRKHPSIPVVALAAIDDADAMAEFEAAAKKYDIFAIVVVFVLLLLCAGVLVAAGKLALRRAADEEVRQVYRLATDAANEGFYMLRPVFDQSGQLTDFQFEDANLCGAFLLGQERNDLLIRPASAALLPVVFHELLELVRKALEFQVADDERRVAAEEKLPSRWLFRRAARVGASVALTLRDISEAKAHEEELLQLAHRDVLTGLPNRLWLTRYLPMALRRARRAHQQLAILFIDLDHFKTVNDTLGHDVGDELLKQATEQLRETLRATDHVVRLGGDEFLILIEQVDNTDIVDALATKIINNLSRHFGLQEGPRNKVSASIGISIFPEDGERADELLKHADIAMYQSKSLGRARHCWYRADMSTRLAARLGIEQALRKAIERNELDIHYQPKFNARSGEVSGVEALVRWRRAEHDIVMPSEFIRIAESTGFIVPLGERVMQQVVAQMAQWQHAGLSAVRVAINMSPDQLRRSDVAGFLHAQLMSQGIAGTQIDIEITESAMVEHSAPIQDRLLQLRALGVRLVIDDFGAGYSSLSQLQELGADVLKMDRELVTRLQPGSDAESLCRGIIWMASALGLKVVAEGVETVEQLRVLRDIGCDELQGFLLSEPLTAAQFEQLLQQPQREWTASLYDVMP